VAGPLVGMLPLQPGAGYVCQHLDTVPKRQGRESAGGVPGAHLGSRLTVCCKLCNSPHISIPFVQNKTKQNKTKQNKTKQNKTKQNKTKRNKTKQNKTKRNETKQNKTKHTHHTETPSSPGSVECTMKRIITNLKFCSHSVCS